MPNIAALNNRFRLLKVIMEYLLLNKIHSSSNDFFLLLLIRLMEMDSSEYIGLTIPRSSFIIDTIDLSKPYNSIDWSRLNLTVTLGLESCETTVSYTFNCRIVKIHPKFSNIIRIWWIEFSFWNSYWKLLITESGQGNTLMCLQLNSLIAHVLTHNTIIQWTTISNKVVRTHAIDVARVWRIIFHPIGIKSNSLQNDPWHWKLCCCNNCSH